MAEIPLPFPIKGLDESAPFSDQPALTSRDILNMRAEDPVTGRMRGAQRAGLSKYVATTINGAQKIQHGTSTTYDSRRVTYSATTLVSGTKRWSAAVPTKASVLNLKTDRQSNVYALDGRAGVAKFNSAGALQWRCALPVQDPLHECRALCVDDSDAVYVGVSAGGDQKKARIFRIVQDLENKTHVAEPDFGAWFLEPGGFIEDMAVQGGLLYTAQNYPDSWGAQVIVYGSLGTAVPNEQWRHRDRETPYPINAIAVKADGSYITSHEPFAGRSQGDPRFPLNSPVLEDWTPDDLTDKSQRIWAWFDPRDLVSEGLVENDEVTFWQDKSGNDRNLFKNIIGSSGNFGPRLNVQGIGGQPTVRFVGGPAVAGTNQALQSDGNLSTALDYADQQKTLLPAYTGATDAEKGMWALFMVFRPTVDATMRQLLGQSGSASSPTADFEILVNRTPGSALPGSAAAGSISLFNAATAGGGGSGGQPGNATASTHTISTASIQACLLAVLNDGGRTATNPKSLWRQNGTPVDRWDSPVQSTVFASEIGRYSGSSAFEYYKGEVSDILVLRDFTGAEDGILSHPYSPDAGGSATGTNGDSEIERIEGWVAWRNGISHLLPSTHPFHRLKGPPRRAGITVESKKLLLLSQQGIVAKWGAAKGDLKWVVTGRIAQGAFPAVSAAGIGYGVTVDAEGNIYCTGPRCAVSTIVDNSVIRKIIDNGDTATIGGVATGNNSTVTSHATLGWSKTSMDIPGEASLQEWTYKYPRLACDTKNNVYIPWHEMNATLARSATIWDKTGQYHLSGAYSITVAGSDAFSVAPDPAAPDYSSDFAGGSVSGTARAEFFYLGHEQDNVPVPSNTLSSVKFSEITTTTGSPRTAVHLAVSGGTVRRFSTSAVTAFAGAGTLAEPQLDPLSQFIGSTKVNSEVFFVDGKQYRVVNPKADTVLEWKSRTGGQIPQRCKLVTTWRGRIVLARGVDDPQNWHMSAFSDPYDWDQFPAVPLPTQAISGNNAQAGTPPDIINALMPWSDDIMDFGCDHSIWRLTGDPMAGGQLDCVSQTIGVAFGPSWCKGPDGAQYFFSSQGGVYMGGYPPTPMTQGRIDREMRDFDFANYYPLLVWNTKDNGLHVLQVPYGAGGVIKRHWFWSKATGGWFPDEFGLVPSPGVQPTTAWVIDGDDANDRTLLMGCEDGQVRRWDEAARADDTTVIEARAMLGPFLVGRGQRRARLTRLSVALADDQDGCRYEMSASETADTPGLPVCQGALSPGQNYPGGVRASGNFCWLLLRNAQNGTRFAIERAGVMAYPAGRSRERLRG